MEAFITDVELTKILSLHSKEGLFSYGFNEQTYENIINEREII